MISARADADPNSMAQTVAAMMCFDMTFFRKGSG